MKQKRCPRCGMTRPISKFGTQSGSKDGRQGYCLDCAREYAGDYRRMCRLTARRKKK